MSETILAVPSDRLQEATTARGFVADRALFQAFGSARFVERDAAESDERLRQIIPYVVARCGRLYFNYARTRRGGEARLHDLRSIGIGGHVNPPDLPGGLQSLRVDAERAIAAAAVRELAEEIATDDGHMPLAWAGFILDDGAPVSRVHLGVVFVSDLLAPELQLSDEGKMTDGVFTEIDLLCASSSQFEGWSRMAIEHFAGPQPRVSST